MNEPCEAITLRIFDGEYMNMLFCKMNVLNYFDFPTSWTSA